MVAIDRRNMNISQDDAVATGRRKLIFSGPLTEARVTFPVLSARGAGYEVHVVGDACGGLIPISHDLSMRRMEAAGEADVVDPGPPGTPAQLDPARGL